MSNMTPFEIRLELLKMARDMLSEEYHGKREVVNSGWLIVTIWKLLNIQAFQPFLTNLKSLQKQWLLMDSYRRSKQII